MSSTEHDVVALDDLVDQVRDARLDTDLSADVYEWAPLSTQELASFTADAVLVPAPKRVEFYCTLDAELAAKSHREPGALVTTDVWLDLILIHKHGLPARRSGKPARAVKSKPAAKVYDPEARNKQISHVKRAA